MVLYPETLSCNSLGFEEDKFVAHGEFTNENSTVHNDSFNKNQYIQFSLQNIIYS